MTEQVGLTNDLRICFGVISYEFFPGKCACFLTDCKGIKKILFFNPLLLSEAVSAYKVSKSLNYSPHYRMTVEKQLYLEGSGLQLSIIAAFSFKQWKPRVSLHALTTLCNTCV